MTIITTHYRYKRLPRGIGAMRRMAGVSRPPSDCSEVIGRMSNDVG